MSSTLAKLADESDLLLHVRGPAALDLGFVGIAEGSLYIGFSTTTVIGTVRELEDAKRLVDLRVRVKGRPEYGPNNDVRLLWVDELEILG